MKQLPMDSSKQIEQLMVLERFNGWEPYDELKKILSTDGIARVYLVATSCGMRSPKRTSTKLKKYATQKKGVKYAELRCEVWEGTKSRARVIRTPALTVLLKSLDAFAELWADAVQVRSSCCRCSVFLSDGQEVDVRVMRKNSTAYGDSQTYPPWQEAYEGQSHR